MYKVLIVEDEEIIRTMLRVNLEKEGYLVKGVGNAEDFLTVIEKEHFDIFLLDIILPAMSGEEALIKIREMGITTPVIVISSVKETQAKVNMLDSGADDYITKPFDLLELLARVRSLIRRSKSYSNQ